MQAARPPGPRRPPRGRVRHAGRRGPARPRRRGAAGRRRPPGAAPPARPVPAWRRCGRWPAPACACSGPCARPEGLDAGVRHDLGPPREPSGAQVHRVRREGVPGAPPRPRVEPAGRPGRAGPAAARRPVPWRASRRTGSSTCAPRAASTVSASSAVPTGSIVVSVPSSPPPCTPATLTRTRHQPQGRHHRGWSTSTACTRCSGTVATRRSVSPCRTRSAVRERASEKLPWTSSSLTRLTPRPKTTGMSAGAPSSTRRPGLGDPDGHGRADDDDAEDEGRGVEDGRDEEPPVRDGDERLGVLRRRPARRPRPRGPPPGARCGAPCSSDRPASSRRWRRSCSARSAPR